MTLNKLIAAFAVFFTFASITYAAPYFRQEAGLVPITDSTYYLGSTTPSTKAWKGVITDQLCLNGDCQTAWPSSGSSSPIATSTAETAGQLPYWTSTSATPATLGGVATTSLSLGTGLSHSGTLGALVGGLAGTLSIATSSLYTGTTGQLPYFSGTNTLTATSSIFLATSGNVGIGTTSPTQLLHVAGTGASSNITISNLTANLSQLIFMNAQTGVNSGAVTYDFSTDKLSFRTAATTNRMVIDSSGNVGIGTTSPAAKLDVYSTSHADIDLTRTSSSNRNRLQFRTAGSTLVWQVGQGAGATNFTISESGVATYLTIAETSGLLTFGNASSTQLSSTGSSYFATSGGSVGIASTSPAFRFSLNTTGTEFYVDSNGKIVGRDTTNDWDGRLSPTRSFGLQTGTTTTWTASTTGSGYSPHIVMPFAGTLRQARCIPKIGATDGSFIGVNVKVNGSNATPSYFVASSTVGKISFTSGNTFTAGQVILADFGTTTTATATSISCTFDVTETP